MALLADRIRGIRATGRAALIPYLTAGDPSIDETVRLAAACAAGGADFVELGIPFSDPLADGPVIQRAVARALASGTRVAGVLACAARVRRDAGIGVVLMTYVNPVLAFGWERFTDAAHDAGCLGLILTDVPADEAAPFLERARAADLGTVFLVAPTSDDRRIRLACESSTGFLYVVSRLGITGDGASLSETFRPTIDRVRRHTDLPVGLGFGVSTPEHAREAGSAADAVIVGSALVRTVEESPPGEAASRLESAVRRLRGGLERSAAPA